MAGPRTRCINERMIVLVTIWPSRKHRVTEGPPLRLASLDATITDMQARCKESGKHFTILTLGQVAFKRIMGLDAKQDRAFLACDYQAYPHWHEGYKAWVIAADHPSYLMRGQTHLLPVLQYCVQRALEVAEHGVPDERPWYLLDPMAAVFKQWVKDYLKALALDPTIEMAYDIETPYKQGKNEDEVEADEDGTILRVSFCYRPNSAVSVPWTAEYLPYIEEIFTAGGTILSWNGILFDDPKVRAHVRFPVSSVDAMMGWHVLNTSMPKGLGFVTPFYWKNCLSAGTRVKLWGSKKSLKISDLVTKRMPATLVGMGENGIPIPVKVTNWYRQQVTDQKWLAITANNSEQPIHCTPDHQIWTQRGWVKAENIILGDVLVLPRVGSNDIIHGTVLGDAHVSQDGILKIAHTVNDQGWIDAKQVALGITKQFMASPAKFMVGPQKRLINCSEQAGLSKWIGGWWRTYFYPNGKKCFVKPPSDQATAIWYGDDGSLDAQKYCNAKSRPNRQ